MLFFAQSLPNIVYMRVISIEISKLKFFLEMLVIERPERVSLWRYYRSASVLFPVFLRSPKRFEMRFFAQSLPNVVNMRVISIEISKLKFFLEMLVIERSDRVSLW